MTAHQGFELDTVFRGKGDDMHINLAELFSQTVSDVTVDRVLELKELSFGTDTYKVVEPIQVHLALNMMDTDEYLVRGSITTTLTIPCNRCMDDVINEVKADFTKEFKTSTVDDEDDMSEYLEGVVLNLEKLVLDEVYMNVPMKVLCNEDCRGICKSCGKNLNHTACDCEDDNVDPRLAGLKDLFSNQFKEV